MNDTNKRRLTISLDPGTFAKLPRINKSLFVEDLLRQHFLIESGDKLYNYIKGRLEKENRLVNPTNSMINGYQPVVQDEELENKREAYASDGWQFRRYNGQLQANKPPSREWVDARMVNY